MARYAMRRPGATSLRRIGATILGLALIAAETRINITHIIDHALPWHEQPLVIAVCIAGLAIAGGVMVLADAWRQRRYPLVLITFLGIAAGVAFTFATTYERTSSAREDRTIALAATGKTKAAANAIVLSATETRDAECAKRGPKCATAEKALEDARVQAAIAPSAKRGGYLGTFEMVPELALPLLLLLLGFAFLAYAEAPSRQDSEQTDFDADGPLPGKDLFEPVAATGEDLRAVKVTKFADAYQRQHGRAPSVRTVARATGLPPSSAHRALRRAAAR